MKSHEVLADGVLDLYGGRGQSVVHFILCLYKRLIPISKTISCVQLLQLLTESVAVGALARIGSLV